MDCSSRDLKKKYCFVKGVIINVGIKKQLSDTECKKDVNFGYSKDGYIWVSNGCGATFTVSIVCKDIRKACGFSTTSRYKCKNNMLVKRRCRKTCQSKWGKHYSIVGFPILNTTWCEI